MTDTAPTNQEHSTAGNTFESLSGPQSPVGEPVSYGDTTILWQGRPSQWANAYTIGIVLLFIFGCMALRWYLADTGDLLLPGEAVEYLDIFLLFAAALALLFMVYCVASTWYERTTITVNKIKEEQGITAIFRRVQYCELARVVDVEAPPAGLLALVGIGKIILLTKDKDQPRIVIRGVYHRAKVIETILPAWRAVRMQRREYFGG